MKTEGRSEEWRKWMAGGGRKREDSEMKPTKPFYVRI